MLMSRDVSFHYTALHRGRERRTGEYCAARVLAPVFLGCAAQASKMYACWGSVGHGMV